MFPLSVSLSLSVSNTITTCALHCSWESYLRKYEKAFTISLKNMGLGIMSFQVADAYHARYLKRELRESLNSDSKKKDATTKFIDVGYGPQTYEQLKQFSTVYIDIIFFYVTYCSICNM